MEVDFILALVAGAVIAVGVAMICWPQLPKLKRFLPASKQGATAAGKMVRVPSPEEVKQYGTEIRNAVLAMEDQAQVTRWLSEYADWDAVRRELLPTSEEKSLDEAMNSSELIQDISETHA